MADWDVVVIGGGAAGLSAGAEAARLGRSCLILDRMGGGGELMNLGPLHGLEEDLTGPDLMARLQEEAAEAGAEPGIAEVTGLSQDGQGWRIATDDETHTARAVILATGLAPGTLGLPNEADFEGMGLSHCATCDGPLFRDQAVIVAGSGPWAVAEARELTAFTPHVTLVSQDGPAPAVDGVTVIAGRVTGLRGASGLAEVVIQPDTGGAPVVLPAEGIFPQTGRRPALDFVTAALDRDAEGRIAATPHTLFAAGDVRAGNDRTLTAAMAEGRAAARAAHDALGKGAA